MLTYKITSPTKILNQIYLPGIFYLSYDWKPCKKDISLPMPGKTFNDIPEKIPFGLYRTIHGIHHIEYIHYKFNDILFEYSKLTHESYIQDGGYVTNTMWSYIFLTSIPIPMKVYMHDYLQKYPT